jgi:hypothetical protein
MKRRLLLATMPAAAFTLAGCASPTADDYAAEKPVLDLRRYFNGMLDALACSPTAAARWCAASPWCMDCRWQGDDGVLDEDFTYSDGTRQRRIWRLTRRLAMAATPAAPTTWWAKPRARPRQRCTGNTPWPAGGRAHLNVQFDDWMYLMDDKVMLNKAVMSKFGIQLGEVTLSFTKR